MGANTAKIKRKAVSAVARLKAIAAGVLLKLRCGEFDLYLIQGKLFVPLSLRMEIVANICPSGSFEVLFDIIGSLPFPGSLLGHRFTRNPGMVPIAADPVH